MSGFPRYAAWHCIRWCSINPIIVLMWYRVIALHSWEAAVAGVLPVPIYADFSASVAYCGLGIIDAAELPWCNALYG